MWEGEKYSPFFFKGKNEGCGKGGNSSGKNEGCEKGKNVPLFYQGRMRDVGRGKFSPFLFIQGRIRDVGKGKIFPIFSSGKNEGYRKREVFSTFIHPGKDEG
jgi:hypothetical protein